MLTAYKSQTSTSVIIHLDMYEHNFAHTCMVKTAVVEFVF